MSDSCGGQNKNRIFVNFTLYLSILLNKNITHIFSVRGHSYNICDTHFGGLSTQFKTKPIIQLRTDYLDLIDKNKFTLIETKVLDFGKLFENYFLTDKSIKLTQIKKIDYRPNGTIYVS